MLLFAPTDRVGPNHANIGHAGLPYQESELGPINVECTCRLSFILSISRIYVHIYICAYVCIRTCLYVHVCLYIVYKEFL